MPKSRKTPIRTKGGQKVPQIHKNKEQLEKEAASKKEVLRQRAIVTEKLWPILLQKTDSISDASVAVQTLLVTVRNQFGNYMMKLSLKDLDLVKNIKPEFDKNGRYAEILNLLDSEKLSDVVNLLDGVSNEIDRLNKKEQHERKLDTLKTDFLQSDETGDLPKA